MNENSHTFFPLAFRMKYIARWGLMRSSEPENLLEHSAECAILAHALALIGNRYFGKRYDAASLAVKALYHDTSEIYTGDLPTPIKYHNHAISESYKDIEKEACERLVSKLPEELRPDYRDALDHDSDPDEKKLIKAADKLCAYIKCLSECRSGDREFAEALQTTRRSLEKRAEDCPELGYFMDNLLGNFEKSLDQL